MKIGFLQRVGVHKDAISLAVKVLGREDIVIENETSCNGKEKYRIASLVLVFLIRVREYQRLVLQDNTFFI